MKQNFVDVFAAVKREYEREVERKAQEQLELERLIAVAKLVSPPTERRLIAAILGDVGVLERCTDVEVEDFTDLRFRAILSSIRELQETDSEISLLAVADDIAMRDARLDKHVANVVDEVFLGCLILDEVPYYGCESLLEHDKRWLRTLAERRRAL